jgi:hypothetical protein
VPPSSGVQLVTFAFTWPYHTTNDPRPHTVTSQTNSLLAKPPHCSTPHHNTTAHYFAYLSRYDHLKAEFTNCTSDDGHVWCPKHIEAIKLHILSHLIGSLPFSIISFYSLFFFLFLCSDVYMFRYFNIFQFIVLVKPPV